MSETKHSPLPWSAVDYDLFSFIYDSRGKMTGRTEEIVAPITPDERKANAELICRAVNAHDDLLAACKELLAEAGAFEENRSRWDRERNDRARAAIAKAEGHP